MPTDLPERLAAFLTDRLGRPVAVVAARQLTGGASRDAWAIDARCGDETLSLFLRRDKGGEIMPDALSRAEEFAVLCRAHAAGVAVARPLWLCDDPDVLGAAFFVAERLDGESVGRRVVREPALAAARARLPRQMGEQLAAIHAVDPAGLALPRPPDGVAPGRATLEKAAAQLAALGEPHPALELAIRWLAARVPACGRPVLCHGDFRVGNLMVGPDGLVGVFDWEFAHVGDPAEDLGWPCVRSWRFGRDDLGLGGVGRPDEFFAAYEAAGGAAVDREAVRFWELLGNLRWAVGCVAQAHRHLSGQARGVELASLGRRACEMELELLDRIGRG